MNILTINLELLKEQNITLIQFSTLVNIYNNEINLQGIDYNLVLLDLQNKGFIKIIKENDKDYFILREKGKLLIEQSVQDKTFLDKKLEDFRKNYLVDKPKDNFDDFVNEYRSLFKGLKIGSQGNLQSVKEKLVKWLKNNPQHSKEDILRTAKLYIHSVDNLKYLQQADYFIYKKDANGTRSRLSDLIDEKEQLNDGWSSSLK